MLKNEDGCGVYFALFTEFRFNMNFSIVLAGGRFAGSTESYFETAGLKVALCSTCGLPTHTRWEWKTRLEKFLV